MQKLQNKISIIFGILFQVRKMLCFKLIGGLHYSFIHTCELYKQHELVQKTNEKRYTIDKADFKNNF